MDITYSTCVNTFNNDKLTVTEMVSLTERLQREKRAYKAMLPVPNSETPEKVRRELAISINTTFKNFLQVSISGDDYWATWKLTTNNYFFILGPGIHSLFELQSDVLSTRDESHKNSVAFHRKNIPTQQSDVFIIIVPAHPSKNESHHNFSLKNVNEKITPEKFLTRFRDRIPQDIAKLTLEGKQFCLHKLNNDNKMIVVNEHLHKALAFNHAGLFHKGSTQNLDYSFNDSNLKKYWALFIVTFKELSIHQSEDIRTVTLPPRPFDKESDAIAFVNSKLNDKHITLTCDVATKRISLNITNEKKTLTVDNNLRDIFAFDKNIYSGAVNYTAKRTFSLTRCIQFLYIYSNLTKYVHIGNTEAPLLAIVPFSNEKGCSLLHQKIFKTPMYIAINQDRISQIDIAVYDGAGQLIPFVSDARTTLRLHFRQV